MDKVKLRVLLEHHLSEAHRLLVQYKAFFEANPYDSRARRILLKQLPQLTALARRFALAEVAAAVGTKAKRPKPTKLERFQTAVDHAAQAAPERRPLTAKDKAAVTRQVHDALTLRQADDFDLLDPGCAKCGCVESGHHGKGVGCEGIGGNCPCDGVFVPKSAT